MFCLSAIFFAIAGHEVRSESPEAKRRAFAERLARRARVERADAHSVSVGARRHAAPATPAATANPYGVPAASPVTPTGYGTGRDGYIESLYPQILGRNAMDSEVAYWSKQLSLGVSPDTVADSIWYSLEHRTEVRNKTAPGIPLNIAIQRALSYGTYRKTSQSP